MKPNNTTQRVSFEVYGRFFPGHVRYHNHHGRPRRVLCFVTSAGALGVSATFSRAEAFNNARKVEHGQVEFTPGTTVADTLRNFCRGLGFPVKSAADEIDDESGVIALTYIAARRRSLVGEEVAAS